MIGPKKSMRSLAAFALPALILAAVFLWVNAELTGSPLRTAYQRAFEYGIENGFRFSHVSEGRAGGSVMASSGGIAAVLGTISNGLIRLNLSLFGWPFSFLFVPLAIGLRRASLWWWSVATYTLSHAWISNPGVDTFGPTHWFEMSLPVLVLTIMGCERATGWVERVSHEDARFPVNFLLALIAGSLLLFSPYRLRAAGEIGRMTGRPLRIVENSGIEDAVIFVDRPWLGACRRPPSVPNHFVFWWPVNDPDFENSVLWANHLSIEKDRELVGSFEGRTGYIATRHPTTCKMNLVPLEQAGSLDIPNGFMGIKAGRALRYSDRYPVTGGLPDGS
jgi:hypothetical protein